MDRRLFSVSVLSGLTAGSPSLRAQSSTWPSNRVNLVIPFPAGAATDITGRVVAARLAQLWNQPVVVENRGGGNGLPAAEYVARAKPDGYTLLLTSAMTHAVNPSLYDKLPYHPLEDFEPITQFGRLPFVVLVRADSPIKTLADLTALLKSEPGKHNFGAGSLPARIAGEMYKQLAGVQAVHIAYKSNPQAFPDLLSGLLTFMVIDTTNGRLQIDGGKMRGLAVTTLQREASLPKVPTTGEAGLPEFQIWTWTGFYAPKGTPRDIVLKAYQDILTACQDPQLQARFESLGGPPVNSSSPDEFAAFTRQEIDRWGRIIRRAQIRLD
jgi:tripartite-type tricarboxylate transporter receptor subunit TctC